MKKRNYLLDSILNTKALLFMIIWGVILTVSSILEAIILRTATDTIQSGNIFNVNILMILSVISIVVSGLIGITNLGVDYSFTYLVNIYTEKIINADYSMFLRWSPSEVMTTGNNIWQYANIIKQIINMIKAIIVIVINIVAICFIDYRVVAPIIGIYIIGGIILKISINKWIQCDKKFDKIKRDRNGELDDIVNGFAELRAYCTEDKHVESIHIKNKKVLSLLIDKKKINSCINIVFELLSSLSTIIIVMYSILVMQSNGISIAKTLNIMVFAARMLGPMDILIDCSSGFSELAATYPRFKEIMDYKNTVSNGESIFFGFNDSIEFKNVDFSYDKSTKIITDLNLTIKKGQKIGICGPTGSGKSTLLKLIPKYYDPDSGNILIDGIDIKNYNTRSIRRFIGTIHQDPYIFNDSILNNVKYGNESASYEQIVDACKKASIYEFILSLEDKFDTQVGPRGLKLSGGQKQRLALARLILKDPEIIILDEATSALDNETEKAIQESLSMFNNKTQIVVAHRLSTIKDSDKIILVDNRKIIEEGTHLELMNKNGAYCKLYSSEE